MHPGGPGRQPAQTAYHHNSKPKHGGPPGTAEGPLLKPFPPKRWPTTGPRGVPYVTPLAGRRSGPILSNRTQGPPRAPLVKIPWEAVRTVHPGTPPGGAGAHPGGPGRRPAQIAYHHNSKPKHGGPQGTAGGPLLKPFPPTRWPTTGPPGVPYVTPLAGRRSGPTLSNRALGPPRAPPGENTVGSGAHGTSRDPAGWRRGAPRGAGSPTGPNRISP